MLNVVSVQNTFFCFFSENFDKFLTAGDEISGNISLFHLLRQIRFKDEIKDIPYCWYFHSHHQPLLLHIYRAYTCKSYFGSKFGAKSKL